MTTEEAIQLHCAINLFEADAAGECEFYAQLQALRLDIETMEEAELINTTAYDRLTTAK